MPKRRPRESGRSPTPSKIEPGKIHNVSRTHSGAFGEHVADPFSKKRSPKLLRTTFACFFSMIAKSVNLEFYRPCRCFRRFFKNARCSIDVSATREKRSKNLRRKPLKSSLDPPGTLQNRARSAPEHPKINRDGQEWLGWLHKWATWDQQWVHGGPNGCIRALGLQITLSDPQSTERAEGCYARL